MLKKHLIKKPTNFVKTRFISFIAANPGAVSAPCELPTLMNEHYYQLRVKNIIQETHNAISVVFQQPNPPMEYKSGQFLTLIVNIEGKEVRRSYSFCSAPDIDEDLAVTVKRVDGGLMSNYLADHLKVGDELRVMEPMGHFTTEYHAANKRHLVMFAGGSGITPFMSHIKSILKHEPHSIISLIYANRNIDSVIFKKELEELQVNNQGKFHAIYILEEAPLTWQGPYGLLIAKPWRKCCIGFRIGVRSKPNILCADRKE